MANFDDLILQPNTRANQPAAGIAGRIYYVTDEAKIERDNGSAWVAYSGGFANPMTAQGDVIYGGASGVATRLAKGTAAQVLAMNAGATAPEWKTLAVSATNDYICIREEQASGTAGGTFTNGAWRTRVLNTESSDTGNHASLASNQITLAAGTYTCFITAPAVIVAAHQAKLYNVTDAADVIIGTSAYTSTNQSDSIVAGKITIADTKVFEVRHICETTRSTNGFGVGGSFSVVVVFTQAQFWKVA